MYTPMIILIGIDIFLVTVAFFLLKREGYLKGKIRSTAENTKRIREILQ